MSPFLSMRGVLGLGLSLAVVACGDDTGGTGGTGGSSSGEGGATSSAGGEGGSSPSTTGASTGAGGGGGEPVDPSTLPDWGLVGFYQFEEGHHEIFATFQQGRPSADDHEGGCTIVERDGCKARRCEGASVPDDAPGLDAGAFTVSGLLVDVAPERGEDGDYFVLGSGPLFTHGSPIDVQFAGADVPAFDATVAMPPQILDLQPSPTRPTRDVDLELTWEVEGTGGQVQVWYLVQEDDAFEDLSCIFPAETGAGTVPGDLMPGGDSGLAVVSVAQRRDVAVGSHAVTLYAFDLALSANFYFAVDEP